ncbi:Mitochondrial import inner membrane translocase subunit TIM44 [Geodia barretti]|uniref:Mitochondrial import inner membrane translocase subunit TIM44 n=1 Tax=Geodia barretti TaxID=519541 RepID=A0AA35WDG8_GEOBA|nr:Mitochondrial import inner membrane translocase subunit TIM44 [Geodia barretti]
MSSIARMSILRRQYIPRRVCVRWSSGGEEGGEERSGKNKRRIGFVENFLSNLQQGLQRNKDMQESLKGLREERERMQRSYVLQRWKEGAEEGWEKAREGGRKGWELVRNSWGKTREGLSKTVSGVSGSELGRRGSHIATKTAEKVADQAEELVKTDVGQAVQKGATVVKEELLDDIIKHSAPYKPPERIQTRAEMSAGHASSAARDEDFIQPNDDTKGVTVTQQSNWRQRWQKLREENPISNLLYSLRMRYDESDHVVVRGSRAVTDRVGDAFGSVMNQSDMALALAEIKKIDRSFDKEKFIERCRFEIIPTVLEVGVAFGIM